MPVDWAGPPAQLKGVGTRLGERLASLGIHRLQELLFHFPLRYEDRTRVSRIGALRPYTRAVVQGTVELTQAKPVGRRALLCRITDGSGALTLRFFHYYPSLQRRLARGISVRCFGEARPGPAGLEMVHPEFEPIDPDAPGPLEQALTPVYPTTQGLNQLSLRRLIRRALELLDRQPLAELLPEELVRARELPGLDVALKTIHAPPAGANTAALMAGTHPAITRLAFEELIAHRLSALAQRRRLGAEQAPRLTPGGDLCAALRAGLPFAPTGAQQRVLAEIEADLGRGRPMLRLLQGDVGSGKTAVAALAAAVALDSDVKVAIMAPTEILAEQHYRVFQSLYAALDVPVLWLTGSSSKRHRERTLQQLAASEPVLIVGTHALFQEGVAFRDLGLVIIDEQHRFGVHQRLALREKGDRGVPHQLIMTATPIPRTLAMTAYADLDTSVIDELPPGRSPVRTVVIPDERRDEVMERIANACAAGRQVYWVCSLIDESETLDYEAATDTAALLAERLSGLRIGLIHGRLKSDDKAAVMQRFLAAEIDVLVATTVIEVGVDVPNASLMIIENAERFGLAQLHQLRGRVGRGARQSDCVLLYRRGLSDMARARLTVMRESHDGFRIAEKDLELRGPGELLGTRQAGTVAYRVADLARDRDLLRDVADAAADLAERDPESAARLIARWLPRAGDYAAV